MDSWRLIEFATFKSDGMKGATPLLMKQDGAEVENGGVGVEGERRVSGMMSAGAEVRAARRAWKAETASTGM